MKMKLTTEHLKNLELLDSVRDQPALFKNIARRIETGPLSGPEHLTFVEALIHVGTALADSANVPTFREEMQQADAVFELTKKMALESERVASLREEEMDRAIKRMTDVHTAMEKRHAS